MGGIYEKQLLYERKEKKNKMDFDCGIEERKPSS